ncbi:MAG: peptidase M14 [Tannerella sp.]|jgi:hypothetical protein|nr:peptidase M14 [Tannerella sp.]
MQRNNVFLSVIMLGMAVHTLAQPQAEKADFDLAYFLPEGYSCNTSIPTPQDVFGFPLGSRHIEWGQAVDYMYALSRASDRLTVTVKGETYQRRPILEVVISSPENRRNIDRIREEHIALTDGRITDTSRMPAIVSLIYSIHGNEASGVNAAVAIAYFLAAAEGTNIEALLSNTVIVMVPGINPDGINRFASWVNSSRSFTGVADPNSREFSEAWPSSRTNHYWADCNRDWLMAQHPEGYTSLKTYLDWLPNIVADHHEQGPSRHYYFSPGHPLRTHPLTPQENQRLTAEISAYCAKELDSIGSLYFSKEGYDDFYLGKGAAYGDIHGSLCLLYEQPSTRGHLRETPHGIRSFAWSIRNQSLSSYATILAGYELKDKLLNYQKSFFENARTQAAKDAVKGYLFDTRGSRGVAYHFLENMARHRIDVYRLAKDVTVGSDTFKATDAFVIPTDQKNYTTIRTLMENTLEYSDSTFYDISAWTFTHAYNLHCATLKNVAGLLGAIAAPAFVGGQVIGGKSDYAYVFANHEFYSHKVIYELLKKGIRVAVSGRPFPFVAGDAAVQMGYGTAVVAVREQTLPSGEIYDLLRQLAAQTGVDIYAAGTGLMAEVDLGSPAYRVLKLPQIAIITGRTMGIPESGEVWFLLDHRFKIPVTLIESNSLTGKQLQRYNVVIMANGVPSFGKPSEDALADWVRNGGTLIASGRAYNWIDRTKLLPIRMKDASFKEDSSRYRPYADQREARAGSVIPGTILNCALDCSHPLGWGFDQTEIAVFKKDNIIFRKDANPYASPLHYTSNPLLSGFVSARNMALLKDAPAVLAKPEGSGLVVAFADDMNFRSYWFGGSKIFLNAIFFGDCLKPESY